jgi:hypothetical protein
LGVKRHGGDAAFVVVLLVAFSTIWGSSERFCQPCNRFGIQVGHDLNAKFNLNILMMDYFTYVNLPPNLGVLTLFVSRQSSCN